MSNTELPAFVAELEEEEKVFGEKEFVSAEVIKGFRSRMGEYVPDLLALVRQLQGENATLQIQASKYAYERELVRRERDRAERAVNVVCEILKEGHDNETTGNLIWREFKALGLHHD